MSVTLSVIIPVYNTEKYIDNCIESVLSQTEKFDEIIIINDGSTDSSGSICDSYAKANSNITLINQENTGQAVARNKGIKQANSEYICFLDSDDYLYPDYVKKVKKNLSVEDIDILYFDAKTVCETSIMKLEDIYNRTNVAPKNVMSGMDYFAECYPEGYRESPCLVVFKLDYLKKSNAQFPPVRIFEDNYFSFITAVSANSVKYIPEKLYVRRYRDNSTMTSIMTYEKWSQLVFCIEKCWDYIQELQSTIDDKYKDVFVRFYFKSLINIYSAANIVFDTSSTIKIDRELNRLQDRVAKELDIFKVSNLSFETAKIITEFQMIFRKVTKNLWSILFGERALANMAYIKYLTTIKNYLEKLPLSSKKRIGIYGTGNHTDKFMLWYEKVIGSINAEVFYIETNCLSGQKYYCGRPIISVNDILDYNIEEIVISSALYEKDMYIMLKDNLKFKGKVYRLYETSAKDIFLELRYLPFDYLP
ncbi:Glycosyltransferase involved in cell wall bisynthesis [Pseudobutyrivibrio sp. UC1225]|uniref:glycosyltransferase family 2 protein n=1 Tax=Pseudobutyrivibrio sp. UC1225 TaxID=1798185 RepID=UPI0008EE9320|nr:glycosyltransferase family 2 protein [Pseudobutyrivibrio sp. UC1225]SFO07021.1 Glycosyltransferase involved in cell wall bisynthesis [Pseudobutyrivibrio sp. UC1225]